MCLRVRRRHLKTVLRRLIRKRRAERELSLAAEGQDGAPGKNSLKHYQRALELCPDSAWMWYRMGTAHGQKGWPGYDQEKSLQCLRKAIALSPRRMMYRRVLCHVLMHFKRYDEAAEEIKALHKIKPKLARELEEALIDSQYPWTWRG